ncbi:DNA polymerase IV [Spiroplasma litorale]|uniref:DNA polymerase IV n=1 Tax=Spiroplasma litorale TaxID=216942 RepID=A0A0K1W1R5_9MOLU|nr:DNA polymerase IV [Spiroplasma litorale]AKX34131.1 DNA polymerase IV [Spiroplasma litorale]
MENKLQNNEKIIFLLDMDAFYAGCHIAENNTLADKNLVVSSPNRRAIILTASYNSRKYGIKAGMPLYKAKEICKDLCVVDTNFQLYINYSEKVFDYIYTNFSKKIEVASIDECYIDVTNIWKKYGTVKKLAELIIKKIKLDLNLSCSIGISTNKFLAKMAVDFNKPSGVTILLKKDIQKMLWPLNIKKMFMIGEATEKLLNLYNITTIKDLALHDKNKLISLIGKRGDTLWNWANGVSSDNVSWDNNDLKSIGNEMTLNYTTNNPKELENLIFELSVKVSDRAKKRYLLGWTVSIVLRYLNDELKENFNLKDRKKHISKQEKLLEPTNEVEDIFTTSKKCFYDLWKGESILLVGVRLTQLVSSINHYKQKEIINWGYKLKEVSENLNKDLLYRLKNKYGKSVIFTGVNYEKINNKNRSQSKYIKKDDVHLSNDQVIKKWKNNSK